MLILAPIFKDLTILTIDMLIVHRIGITMYKYSSGFLPDVFNTLYIKNSEIHTYSTRSKDLYHIFYQEHKHFQTSVLKFGIH